MAIKFVKQDVADKFETDYETDPIVHLPGGKNKNGWQGRLSTIPLSQAERWIDHPKQNLLKRKVTPAAATSKKKEEEKT